jgi:hypothetical protein
MGCSKYRSGGALSRRAPVSRSFFAVVIVLAALDVASVHAQEVEKAHILPPVLITATPFEDKTELDVAQPVSVLKGDDLRRKREASLGDTLSRELGVTSSFFGPGAGRPIIRVWMGRVSEYLKMVSERWISLPSARITQ